MKTQMRLDETEYGEDVGYTEATPGWQLPPKLALALQSRKVWAGLLGLGVTLCMWWLGEIDGPAAVEALSWVVGIFIGAVALEDGMVGLLRHLSGAQFATRDDDDDRRELEELE
jgi:hypothetical protein